MNRRQSGATLVLCVMLLASLSLLGISAASDSLLQQRMGTNRAISDAALRDSEQRLRGLEAVLLALPGLERPPGCPDACVAGLPTGTLLEELHVQPADAAGLPMISWFLLTASSDPAATVVVTAQSVLARPWGDAAWSGDAGICHLPDPATPCGRQGWQQVQP